MPAAEVVLRQHFAAQRLGILERRLLEIAGRQHAEAVEDRQVGDRAEWRYLSVTEPRLRRRSDAAIASTAPGRATAISRSPHSAIALRFFDAHHRADAAAARMAPFIADRGEANEVLAGRPMACDPERPGESSSDRIAASRLRRRSFRAGDRRGLISTVSSLDEQVRHEGGLARDHQGVDAEALQLDGEMARRQRVGDEAGERRLRHDGELGRGREAGADERRAREDQRIGGRERIDTGGRVLVEQARAESNAAKVARRRDSSSSPIRTAPLARST